MAPLPVYNINKGYNTELLAKCKFLREYMIFVDYVRLYNAQGDFKDFEGAIEKAIDRCIEEGILKDFLIKNRSEVVKVMKLDYSFNRQLELEREDSYEEGVERGKDREKEANLRKLIIVICKKIKKSLSLEYICEALEESEDVISPIYHIALKYNGDESKLDEIFAEFRKN